MELTKYQILENFKNTKLKLIEVKIKYSYLPDKNEKIKYPKIYFQFSGKKGTKKITATLYFVEEDINPNTTSIYYFKSGNKYKIIDLNYIGKFYMIIYNPLSDSVNTYSNSYLFEKTV